MIKILCLAALCLTAVAGFPREERIINGSPATIDQYPFIARILISFSGVSYGHRCGGAIINNRSVLTAAHCLVNIAVSQLATRVGAADSESGGYVHNVASFILHPDYTTVTHEDDIAVMRVTRAFYFGANVQVARIAGPNYYPADNDAVWAVGWGLTENNEYPDDLLHVQISVVSQNVCESLYGWRINERTICAGGGGYSVCSGDSGGPLVHNNVVVGVVSVGPVPCGDGPAIFARVSYYVNWIQQNA